MAAGLLPSQVNRQILLAFMEYLVQNQLSASNIANHMAAIKAQYTVFGLDTTSFGQISIRINHPLQPLLRKVIDIPLLANIMTCCDRLQFTWLYKSLYLMAFSPL